MLNAQLPSFFECCDVIDGEVSIQKLKESAQKMMYLVHFSLGKNLPLERGLISLFDHFDSLTIQFKSKLLVSG